MSFLIQLILGIFILGVFWLALWAIRHAEQAKEKRWLAPLTFYLSNLSLRRWTVNVLGAALILWFANFYINWIQPALTPADLFPPEFTGPVGVKAWKADRGPVVNVATYTGTVEPFLSNDVYARVDGFVESMFVYEGDYVEQGQVLAKLDLSNIRPQLLKAIADSAFLYAELERAKNLYENKAITASELDKMKKMYQQAAAQVELMRAQVVYAEIRAGISGYVAERRIYPGQYVKRGEKLFRIDQLDRVRIKFSVPEEDLPFIRPGDPVILEFPQFSPAVFERYTEWLRRVEPLTDDRFSVLLASKTNPASRLEQKNEMKSGRLGLRTSVAVTFPAEDPVTRTGTVEVRLSNPGILLKSHAYVVGKFAVARVEDAIRIPSKAVVHTPDGKTTVFVAPAMSDQGFAEAREVTIGLKSPVYAQVLSGVEPDEFVVYSGMKNLTHGQSIIVLERKE